MSQQIRRQPYAKLGRLYLPVDRQFPDAVDGDAPVTYVHDLSRTAELNNTIIHPDVQGIFQLTETVTHPGGADTKTATVSVYNATPISSSSQWVWLRRVAVSSDTANCIGTAQVSIGYNTVGLAFAGGSDELIRMYDGDEPMHDSTGGGFDRGALLDQNRMFEAFPMLIPPTGTIGFRSVSDAAGGEVMLMMELIMLPLGVFPPGQS